LDALGPAFGVLQLPRDVVEEILQPASPVTALSDAAQAVVVVVARRFKEGRQISRGRSRHLAAPRKDDEQTANQHNLAQHKAGLMTLKEIARQENPTASRV